MLFRLLNLLYLWDHPRIRGTNPPPPPPSPSIPGSSPHTRDKCTGKVRKWRKSGIIPAYAGQIYVRGLMWTPQRDHPRIRGTNGFKGKCRGREAGSSPHTRDKFGGNNNLCGSTGIIPAYAGQIARGFHIFCQGRDHPRIRGTNKGFILLCKRKEGSSPHTRDKYLKIP